MTNKMAIAALAAAVGFPLAVHAQAPDAKDMLPQDLHFGVGVRVWQTDWSTWGTTGGDYHHADLRTTFIPVVSASYRNWFVSGSYQLARRFDFRAPVLNQTFERKEYDLNVGYFVLPGLALSVGYKHIDYNSTVNNYEWKSRGPTVGVVGNAPINDKVALYGNLAVGWPHVDDTAVFHNERARYLLTEFGFAFPLGPHANALQGAVLTAGYRYQRIGAYPTDSANGRDELFETTQGPVVGVAMRF